MSDDADTGAAAGRLPSRGGSLAPRRGSVPDPAADVQPVTPPLRVANCSGFYGDRLSAAREMVEGGPIDVLTGDWLAELTMLILAKDRLKNPDGGFAKTFLRQMEDVLGSCLDKGIRIVSNAGGLNPAGCAAAVEKLAAELGLSPRVAHVTGDDVLGQLPGLLEAGHPLANLDTGQTLADAGIDPLTANAYLGGWGIREALAGGADVVVTGRVTDAAVVVGAAAAHFGWARTDWDELAGAVVAGHLIECGTQCCGGNYAFFEEVPGIEHIGFPIAEIAADGSSVITKHPGTGGMVTVGTVTAQLLYEIQGVEYANPDATVRLNSVRLAQEGDDRVRVSGVRGLPGPETAKVAINYLGGYRNSMTFVLTGLDIEEKAAVAERTLFSLVPGGRESFESVDVRLRRTERENPATNDDALAELRITVMDADEAKVGRAFSNSAIEMVLASYPGLFTTSPPSRGASFGVYWPTLIPSDVPPHRVVLDSTTVPIDPPPTRPPALTRRARPGSDSAAVGETSSGRPGATPPEIRKDEATLSALLGGLSSHRAGSRPDQAETSWVDAATERLPLGRVVGARSGDKGGNANVGLWTRSDDAYDWLAWFLTVDRLRELAPAETDGRQIERFDLPNVRALNIIFHGLLGRGVAASARTDPQAKGLGEYLRAKVVDVPVSILDTPRG